MWNLLGGRVLESDRKVKFSEYFGAEEMTFCEK